MTVILASLAMDLWRGLLLPRRMNEYLLYCLLCFFHSLVPTMRYWEEKNMGVGGRDICKYPLFAEPCFEMPGSQRATVAIRRAVRSDGLSSNSHGLQLHACPLVELSFLFSVEGFSPESSMYFPRNTGVLQDYMFSLEGS